MAELGGVGMGIGIDQPGVVVVEPKHGTIVSASQNFAEMLGFEQDELKGKSIRELHPGDMDALMRAVNGAVEDGVRITNGLSCRRKDGRHVPADIHFVRLGDSGEFISGIIVPVAQMVAKDPVGHLEFLASRISKDINTLLSYSAGTSDLLDSEGDDRSKLLEVASTSIEKSGEMMRQFMRIVGAIKDEQGDVDVSAHITELTPLLDQIVNGKNLSCSLSKNVRCLPLCGAEFDQVILNLVALAREQAGDSGNVTIKTFPAPAPEGWSILQVINDGPVPAGDPNGGGLASYFNTESQSIGVGCATALAIVRKSGGTLEFFRDGWDNIAEARFPGDDTALPPLVLRT